MFWGFLVFFRAGGRDNSSASLLAVALLSCAFVCVLCFARRADRREESRSKENEEAENNTPDEEESCINQPERRTLFFVLFLNFFLFFLLFCLSVEDAEEESGIVLRAA